MALRIVSLNAWGGRLHRPLLDYLAACNADIYCLQEIVRDPASTVSEWSAYRDGDNELAQRTNLFEEIRAALPEHDAFFAPNATGDLFVGDDRVPTFFGLATFVRRTLAVVGQATDFVHGSFSAEGFGVHPRPRNAHCVRLYEAEGGRTLTVCHMHGLRDLAGKSDTEERDAQARSLLRLIRQVWAEGEPLIVCGDFNVLPDSRTFEILSEAGLADLVTARGFTDTRTSHYSKDVRFADYMLTNSAVKVIGFDVVEWPEVSDHRPLLLEMK